MEPSPHNLAIALPPALWAQVEKMVRQSRLPAAELIRDLLEQGLAAHRWLIHVEQERQLARSFDLPEGDAAIDGANSPSAEACIAIGMQSLREGRSQDGKKFMADFHGEQADLERQGR